MAYNANPYDGETDEEKLYPFLSFYLREVALYMHHHFEEPMANYSLDADLSPELKVIDVQFTCTHTVNVSVCAAVKRASVSLLQACSTDDPFVITSADK
jgi:hypothetical protein